MSRSNRPREPLHPDLVALDQAHIRIMQQIAADMDAIYQRVDLTNAERTAQLAIHEQRLTEHWVQFHAEWRRTELRLAAQEVRSSSK